MNVESLVNRREFKTRVYIYTRGIIKTGLELVGFIHLFILSATSFFLLFFRSFYDGLKLLALIKLKVLQ